MNTQTIDLDIAKRDGFECVTVGQGDNLGTTIEAHVYENGAELVLTGYTVAFMARLPDKLHYVKQEKGCSVSGSVITCVVDESKVASVAGYTSEAYFAITKGGATYSTERFALDIKRSALDGQKPAESWDDTVHDLLESWGNQQISQGTEFSTAQTQRQTAYENAEKSRQTTFATNENARKTAESARVAEEGKRATAESGRASDEAARKTAESARAAEEGKRVTAESARATKETARQADEANRAKAEAARATEEGKRATAESGRASAEAGRAAKETARQTDEAARASADAQRATQQAKNNADQALNNAAMAKNAPYVCHAGEYDTATLMPTVAGDANRVYFVPYGQGPANRYVEWMYVEGAWEMMGISDAEISPIDTAQIDAVIAGTATSGENVLNLTGFAYVWAKIKAMFAPKSHADAAGAYGTASKSLFGHAKASSTVPKANGTASAGAEASTFASGDHVHPLQTAVSGSSGSCTGNAATATKLQTARSIALSGGDVTGSANFDGSAGVSIKAVIAALAVKTGLIADAAVTTPKIADNAITSAKIANGTITADDLAAALLKRITDMEGAWASVAHTGIAVERIELVNYTLSDGSAREIAIAPKIVTAANFVCGMLDFYKAYTKSAIVSLSSCSPSSVTLRADATQEYEVTILLLYRP